MGNDGFALTACTQVESHVLVVICAAEQTLASTSDFTRLKPLGTVPLALRCNELLVGENKFPPPRTGELAPRPPLGVTAPGRAALLGVGGLRCDEGAGL